MAQFIVRDVDDEIAKALRLRAKENGRSVEAEHRMILREVLARPADRHTDFATAAARLRARLAQEGRGPTNSAALIRDGRNDRTQ